MHQTNNTQAELLRLYLEGEATAAQAEQLFELLVRKRDARSVVSQLRQAYLSSQKAGNKVDAETTERMHQAIKRKIQSSPQVHRILFLRTPWFKYAAAIIILLTGVATYFFINASQSAKG